MLIWYSQEARSYALLVFFCAALAALLRARAATRRGGRDLALWALASALALCSHYFAVFAVAIEALWLLVALRARWRVVLPALAAVGAVGLALLPLINAQVNPTHIGWIENSPLADPLLGDRRQLPGRRNRPRDRRAAARALRAGAGRSWSAPRCCWSPSAAAAASGAAPLLGLVVGLGVAALAAGRRAGRQGLRGRAQPAAGAGAALAVAAAIGFAADRARRLGLLLAVALCAYWLAFDVHVTQTPNLQRPDFRTVTDELGPAAAAAARSSPGSSPPTRCATTCTTTRVRMYGGDGTDARNRRAPQAAGDRPAG